MKLTKTWKIVLITLGVILALFEGIRLFALFKIKSVLNQEFVKAGNRGFHIDYKDLNIGWIRGSIYLKEIDVTQQKQLDTISQFSIQKLSLEGISIRKALVSKKLDIEHIHVSKARVQSFDKNIRYDSIVLKKREPVLENVNIGKILINDLLWRRYNTDNVMNLEAFFDKVSLGEFGVETGGPHKGTWKIGSADVEHLSVDFPTVFYNLAIENLNYSKVLEELRTKNVKLTPKYSKAQFAKKSGQQIDRLEASINELLLKDFSFLNEQGIFIQASSLDFDFRLEAFRDKTIPFTSTKRKPLPVEVFEKIKVKYNIDTIRIKKSFVAYEEIIAPERGTGRIFFDDIDMKTTHFSNDTHATTTHFDVKARFMDAANMEIAFTLPPKPNDTYHLKGSMGRFDLTRINNMLKSAALLEAKTGTINQMDFNFEYDDARSHGAVVLNYSDLNLIGYKKKQPEKTSIFKTLFINQMLKVNDIKEATVKGRIEYARDERRSVFHYWWNSLLSGLKAAFITDGTLDPKKLDDD